MPTTSQGTGVTPNATPANTGTGPKQPEGRNKKRRTINTIAESLDPQSYDEYRISNVCKEYNVSFTNSDGNEEILFGQKSPTLLLEE